MPSLPAREALQIRPIGPASADDLGALLATDKSADGCWCMWFITSVKAYHAARGDGNRSRSRELMGASRHPMGLVAYLDGEAVGWCAVGPRSRYARAIATPSYKGRDPAEDERVWLIPCLFVRKDQRGSGIGDSLVRAALALAAENGAEAVEAFPHAGTKHRGADTQVGFEPLFARCGFSPLRRPSETRVVMRAETSRR
jgi:GNAT superfamily N-acetyltransferase